LQRLFTTFADSWPGFGLLIQRLVTGLALICRGIVALSEAHYSALQTTPQIAGTVLGLFIVAGLWTPAVGALIAVAELWIAFAGGGSTGMPIILAVLGGTLAMIGPGAWSIDARLFGRKRLPT
jgi:putative oxidoreductase